MTWENSAKTQWGTLRQSLRIRNFLLKEDGAGFAVRNDADSVAGNLTVDNLVCNTINGSPPGGGGGGSAPYHALMFAADLTTTGGTWTLVSDANQQPFAHYYQNDGVQNRAYSYPVALAAGTWNLKVHGFATTNSGIVTWRLGGTLLGTTDMYNNPGLYNVQRTMNFSLAAATAGTLEGKLETKNASSSSYFWLVTKIVLVRTG